MLLILLISLDFVTKGPFIKYAVGLSSSSSFSISLGSSPFFMMSFFGMCVAFLAGTALMIVKKSRDKRDDYTLLASGSQEQ